MSSTTVVFHLHGRDASSTGVAIVVPDATDFKELQNIVGPKFNILDPLRISFCKSSDRAGLTHALEPVSAILAERTVGILVDEQTPRPVPGPEGGLPIIGGYSELYPDFLGNYQRLLDKYGHMAHVAYMGKHVYLTDDPDIVTHVLHEGEFFKKEITEEHPLFPLKLVIPIGLFTIDSSDPRWAQSHKLLMAALSARAMRNYVKIMDRSNDGLNKNVLSKFAESGEPFNVFPWMLRTAAQTIGEVALNLDLGMLSGPDADVAQIFKDVNTTLKLSQDLVRKGKWYRNLPNPEARAQAPIKKRQFEYIQDLVRQSVAKGTPDMPYQKAATSTESILDFMVHALDEDGNKLSIELLVDDVLTFLGAGQVTTSSALSWLFYTLSHHKDKAEKLYESLLDAGLTADGEITAEHLSNLEYLDWYIKETQRLYNPAFQPTRQALQDVVLPGGYMVPKGAQVTVALHSIHVNKEHWTDPYKFNPERWGTEEVRKRHKNAYIPFATGARGCIGFAFALQEMKLVIARVVLNFTIKDVTHGPVVYDPDFSIYRPLNFMATVAKRPPPGERKTAPKSAEPPSPVQEEAPKVGNLDLPKLYVCYGSNNGTTQGFASELVGRAKKLGFSDVTMTTLDKSPLMGNYAASHPGEKALFLIVCCSYNGEAPDNAVSFDEMLENAVAEKKADLFANVKYTVFGTGNRQWAATYQRIPNKIDSGLAALGGQRFFEKGTGDASADQDGEFTTWTTKLFASISTNLGLAAGANLVEPPAVSANAVTLEFIKATTPCPRTAPVEGMQLATMTKNLELVDQDTPLPRGMRLITFTLPEGQTYEPGDHIEVFPENNAEDVERMINNLGLVPEAIFEVKDVDEKSINSRSLAAYLKGRGPICVRDCLMLYADLSGPLPRYGLQAIAAMLPREPAYEAVRAEFGRLGSLPASDKSFAEFALKNRNVVVLAKNYPQLGRGLNLGQVLVALGVTQPRRYSIATSLLAQPGHVGICVGAVLPGEHNGRMDYEGLCSGFLRRAEVGQKVWLRTRQAQAAFHLPQDPKTPVLMIGAGTGIAPFLAFMEHRAAQGLKEKDAGGESTTRLYYGTWYHDMPTLRKVVADHVETGTASARAVYSEEHGPRRFAQELLLAEGLDVWSWLERGAHIYVCGSAQRVGAGVRKALTQIAAQIGAVDEPESFVATLSKAGRYSEDVFG